MKPIIIYLLSLITISAAGQVSFLPISFNEALIQAKAQKKLVMLQLLSDECSKCNEVADMAFDDADLGKKVADKCIAIKIPTSKFTTDYPEWKEAIVYSDFSTLFFSAEGDLIHQFPQTTSRAIDYINQLQIASDKLVEGYASISELAAIIRQNPKDFPTMEILLEKRKNLHLASDSLLNMYVSLLPEDSMQSQRVLIFISRMAPVIGSIAYRRLRTNNDLFNQAWYQIPLAERIRINVYVRERSFAKAVKDSNVNYFGQVYSFIQNVHYNSPAGIELADKYAVRFSKSINDSGLYVRWVRYYIQKHIMSKPVEEIRKKDDSLKLVHMNRFPAIKEGNKIKRQFTPYMPIANMYAHELNEAAWHVYTKITDAHMQRLALAWIERASQLHETPEILDTYARLLYRKGDRLEAINVMQRSLAMLQENSRWQSEFTAVLGKMKTGAEKIDEY